ncbi:BRO-N domain-containing protein [Halomonas sp. H5]|uniref:BRO-N domain-containing protein n=1 Tax=Halomonas sp. H5 TaxID=3423910 RepID=UPI003D36D491
MPSAICAQVASGDGDDGEPIFVAKDVMLALEYGDTSNVAKAISHVPGEWKGREPIPTPGGAQPVLTLTEQGLYFFVARSDKPKAMPFQKWLAGEVLPSIRRTGGYQVTPSFEVPTTLSGALRLAADQAEKIEQQQD